MTYSAVPVPCRVFDSRHLAVPAPLAPNSTTGIGVKGSAWSAQGGDTGCALPPDAKAALLAITWIAPDRSGHITLFQSGVFAIMPHATTAYAQSGVTGTGSATVELCNDLDCGGIDLYLYTFPGAHYTVDLIGYFVPAVACPPAVHTADLRYRGTPGELWVPPTSATSFFKFGPPGRSIRLAGEASQPGVYLLTALSPSGKRARVIPAPQTATDQALDVVITSEPACAFD